MKRRTFLATATAAAFAAPHVSRADTVKTIKFKPNADLTIVDTAWTTAFSTKYLALLSYDTLYGVDNALNPHPQMAAGHVVENDQKTWRITLRDGLKFHDGTPVLASDCVASVKRWGNKDVFGQMLMAATDELSAADDKTIVFRLKKTVSAAAQCAREEHQLRAGDHAGASDRGSVEAGHPGHRQRPVPLHPR